MVWQWKVLLAVVLVAGGDAQITECPTQSGNCVFIRDCPDMLQLLRDAQANTPTSSASLQTLRSSICGFEDRVPKVCCGLPQDTHGVEDLLPSDCGHAAVVDRIIGGVDAPILAWPWIALLRARESGRGSRWVCGGTIISKRYVLTAAHCVAASSGLELQLVRVGEHDLSRDPDCVGNDCLPSFQDIRVENITVHEQYGKVRGCPKCHDIALLRLAKTLTFDNIFLTPICLPKSLEQDLGITNRNFDRRPGWVAGWGTVDPREEEFSTVLQNVQVPINDNFCERQLNDYPDRNMVFCAGGEPGKDSCRGDSGGPLILDNQDITRSYLLGIVSRGPLVCGLERTQGIYTNVNHYMPWIIRNLRP